MKKLYIVFGIFLTVFFIFVLIGYFSQPTQKKPVPNENQTNISPDALKADYSNLNKILPGQSTISDVVRLNGQPTSTKTIGSKKYLYFQTPIKTFNNFVVFEKGVVVYALENVFGEYRGRYENFTSSYGQPDLTLYDNTSSFIWYIFLQNGVGVQTNGKDVTGILYFIPQNENSFLSGIAEDVGLSRATPRPEVLRP